MLLFDILTLFPGMFAGPFSESMLGRAQTSGHIQIRTWDIRDFATDKHRTVDAPPYGGGPGMVMKVEPIVRAVEHVQATEATHKRSRLIMLAPQGRPFEQSVARELAHEDWLIFLCGHYEGIDDRVRQILQPDVISMGDFVLTGGEPAAIAMIDAIARLVPGVLGDPESAEDESFGNIPLLEYPQYTRPQSFRGFEVPDVLLSGHHGQIEKWRRTQSLRLTWQQRPDLLAKASLLPDDERILQKLQAEDEALKTND